jgi:transcription antitermination factor NusG
MPMFPTYLFVNADLERYGKTIRYTPGVRDFVRACGAPQVVPPEIVATLRERIGPSGIFEPPARSFAPGERLRIEAGPLQGLDVVFERELSSAGRVAVLLAEIEFAARVIVDRRQLVAA